MLHAICHLGSSNLRLVVEPKRQIELLLSLRCYFLWLTMLMAFVHALYKRIGPPWQLQHTWIGVRSCVASTSFAMAARSCCTGATLMRFSIFPRTLTGCPSCQAFSPPVRVAACVAANCARCEAGRGGFQFPWIGTFFRRDALVEAGIPTQVAWARVSACGECLSAEEVRQASSGLTVDDVAPSDINRLVAVLVDQQERGNPRLATADDLWQVNKASDAGGNRHIRDPVARAGRTLWFWLGSVEAGLENLYSPCAACGFPTALLCHVCRRFVCFDCTRSCRACRP